MLLALLPPGFAATRSGHERAAVTTIWSTAPDLRNSAATLSSSVTSTGMAETFSFAASSSSRVALRDAIVTSAPSALASSAVASPMPDEPP
nr:hypothetical protein [Bradyrhizobium sp.]